nr:hypothetical protein [Smithella sp.]
GEYIAYYKNGQIKEKGFFKNDKREGEYIAYYKSGQIREKATYKNGNCVGKFLAFEEEISGSGETNGSESDTEIWDEKDVANLLEELKHFDKKQK